MLLRNLHCSSEFYVCTHACFAFSFRVECISLNEVGAEMRTQHTTQHEPERHTCKDAKKLKGVEKEYGPNYLSQRSTQQKKQQGEENNWQIAQRAQTEKHSKEVQITMDANEYTEN